MAYNPPIDPAVWPMGLSAVGPNSKFYSTRSRHAHISLPLTPAAEYSFNYEVDVGQFPFQFCRDILLRSYFSDPAQEANITCEVHVKQLAGETPDADNFAAPPDDVDEDTTDANWAFTAGGAVVPSGDGSVRTGRVPVEDMTVANGWLKIVLRITAGTWTGRQEMNIDLWCNSYQMHVENGTGSLSPDPQSTFFDVPEKTDQFTDLLTFRKVIV